MKAPIATEVLYHHVQKVTKQGTQGRAGLLTKQRDVWTVTLQAALFLAPLSRNKYTLQNFF